jgi:hypothetical protein
LGSLCTSYAVTSPPNSSAAPLYAKLTAVVTHRRPAARRAAPEKPPVEDELPLNEDVLPSIVYNNDGEPNADYQVFVERRHARPFFRASRSAKTPFLRLVS